MTDFQVFMAYWLLVGVISCITAIVVFKVIPKVKMTRESWILLPFGILTGPVPFILMCTDLYKNRRNNHVRKNKGVL